MKSNSFHDQYPELIIWSSYFFVISALLIRIVYTIQTAVLLNLFSIYFEYRPYGIVFEKSAMGNWTLPKIFIVYGFGAVVYMLIGIFLLWIYKRIELSQIKIRLFIIWLAFVSIHILPLGMVSGVFIYHEFGIAYEWLLNNRLIQSLGAVLALIICIFMRPYWIRLFQETAFSPRFIDDDYEKAGYINVVLKIPYLAGAAFLILFAMTPFSLSWLIFLGSLSLIVFLDLVNRYPDTAPVKVESFSIMELKRSHYLFMLFSLAALYAMAFIRIKF